MRYLFDIIQIPKIDRHQYMFVHNNQGGIYVDYLVHFDNEHKIIVYTWIRFHGSIKKYLLDDMNQHKNDFDPIPFFSNLAFFIKKIKDAKKSDELNSLKYKIFENFISDGYYHSPKAYNFLMGYLNHKRFNLKPLENFYLMKTPKFENLSWDLVDSETFNKLNSLWNDKDNMDKLKFQRCLELTFRYQRMDGISEKIYDLPYPHCVTLYIVDMYIKKKLYKTFDNIINAIEYTYEWYLAKIETFKLKSLYQICLEQILENDYDLNEVSHLYLPDFPLDGIPIIET